MKRVGLVGENPNDTFAIKSLLLQKTKASVDFFVLLNNVNGSDLDNEKLNNRFRKEFEYQRDFLGVDFIIFMRDLDALESDGDQKRERRSYFNKWNKTVDGKGIFLLNIFELEALIWADIEAYNQHVGANIPQVDDPMLIFEPKEELQKYTRYTEAQSREIFAKLRIDIVAANCRYFQEFLLEFEKRIA